MAHNPTPAQERNHKPRHVPTKGQRTPIEGSTSFVEDLFDGGEYVGTKHTGNNKFLMTNNGPIKHDSKKEVKRALHQAGIRF
jgi:hypothetical protein